MSKVKSLDDLKKMREMLRGDLRIRENSNHPELLPQVCVSMDTCGIAAGAREVMIRFVDRLGEEGIDAVVTQTGCMGHCDLEPVVEITLPGGEPVVYGNVDAQRVEQIIDRCIRGGEQADGIVSCGTRH